MSKRILVTGAGGFVGKHLIEALTSDPSLEVFANVFSSPQKLTSLLPQDHIIPADLTDYQQAQDLLSKTKPDIIYHLASLSVVQSSAELAGSVLTNNLLLQYNLLEAIKQNCPKARLITISTGNVYGEADPKFIPMSEYTPLKPLNPYATSKLAQEFLSLQYHLAHGLDVVILRAFNHTGPGQTTDFIVPMLAKQFVEIKKGNLPKEIVVGNTGSKRDFTDVQDMVQAYILASKHAQAGEVYNLGTGVGVGVGEIINTLSNITGLEVVIKVEAKRVRRADVPLLVADSSKFRRLTGWEPKTPLRDTLKSVLAYWEEK